jgi:hypothetical protein
MAEPGDVDLPESADDRSATTRRVSFPSRKNFVYRVDGSDRPIVVKAFSPERADLAQKEFHMLEECIRRGVRVPRPLALRGPELLEEHVDGVTASDGLDSLWNQYISGNPAARTPVSELVDGVAEWLAGFHRAFGFNTTRGDSILKNFIIGTDGSVTGIDFEESVMGSGNPLDDLGELCSYVISMRPAFTRERISLAATFADKYWSSSGTPRDQIGLARAISRALRRYSHFRTDPEEMIHWAARFESGDARL